jgi:hypothetical protein
MSLKAWPAANIAMPVGQACSFCQVSQEDVKLLARLLLTLEELNMINCS